MNSKEKAKELFDEYAMYLRADLMYDEEANEDAKQCALIAVDQILKHCYEVIKPFWQEVKQEIEKITKSKQKPRNINKCQYCGLENGNHKLSCPVIKVTMII